MSTMKDLYWKPETEIIKVESQQSFMADSETIPIDEDIETETQWAKEDNEEWPHFSIWDD